MKRGLDEKIKILEGYYNSHEDSIRNCAASGREVLESIKKRERKQIHPLYSTFNTYYRNYQILLPSQTIDEINKVVQSEYNQYIKKIIKNI